MLPVIEGFIAKKSAWSCGEVRGQRAGHRSWGGDGTEYSRGGTSIEKGCPAQDRAKAPHPPPEIPALAERRGLSPKGLTRVPQALSQVGPSSLLWYERMGFKQLYRMTPLPPPSSHPLLPPPTSRLGGALANQQGGRRGGALPLADSAELPESRLLQRCRILARKARTSPGLLLQPGRGRHGL